MGLKETGFLSSQPSLLGSRASRGLGAARARANREHASLSGDPSDGSSSDDGREAPDVKTKRNR